MHRRIIDGTAVEGSWLRAETQSSGVGRLGRKWESPRGNLYCSGLVQIRAGDPEVQSLSFVAALALHDVIKVILPDKQPLLKWPNDIEIGGAKACGILLERAGDFVVVGIGVNVAVAPDIAGRKVTCLAEQGMGEPMDAAQVMDLLADRFSGRLKEWRQEGLAQILKRWQAKAYPIGTPIRTSDAKGKKIDGGFDGLTSDGGLRLRCADGSLIEIRAGDIEIAG